MEVRKRRRGREFAKVTRYLAEEVYPDFEKIRSVVDNLNIHTPAAFYEAFEAERARELSRRIEVRYTPVVHGSWLNMAEIDISVLVRQRLGGRRIPEVETLRWEARAWCEARNLQEAKVVWRYTIADTRTKLRKLYPSIEP